MQDQAARFIACFFHREANALQTLHACCAAEFASGYGIVVRIPGTSGSHSKAKCASCYDANACMIDVGVLDTVLHRGWGFHQEYLIAFANQLGRF